MANTRFYATGRRKEATARVWIKPGSGQFMINQKPIEEYFGRQVLRWVAKQPFLVAENEGGFDVWCTVAGGGKAGQAGAIRHGVSRALVRSDETNRTKLKRAGLLTRDSRTVERKKYGRPGARKRFQFSKR
jgi:small subunit ribosomal protein S9